ncbi:hypothetical protein [Limosilactobacillus oris]|jgi:hypothetical protein|uniref:hypothetical protein n=1 Tax=Limosilactobacillus oris TaxID=1632 RepID=UPI001959309F|nr:hypothetical protein [Limosilactobacillus oris]VTX54574.1 Uncharacterised protein [Limosilactobacillus oris]DAJ20534.1 MAG TPA: hypothetical protein [Myoviridae sp. ctPkE24]
MPPSVALYSAIVKAINGLGVDTYSVSQDIEKKSLPICRVQLLSSNSTGQFLNARQYEHSFQLDVVTDQGGLEQGLTIAYMIMRELRKISVDGFLTQINGEPSLNSMVDSSTNRILNRQTIRVNYDIIEDTAF